MSIECFYTKSFKDYLSFYTKNVKGYVIPFKALVQSVSYFTSLKQGQQLSMRI